MDKRVFDLVVIGAGPGGYVAAIRASQLGMTVACIDSRSSLGGTCLNVGCIPSKALLQSSEKYLETNHDLADHGIKISDVSLDLGVMIARKDRVVESLTKGIAFLFKKNGVEQILGRARVSGPGEVFVETKQGEVQLNAQNILIATGSESIPLSALPVDEKRIVSSTGALSLDKVPEHLAVIGAGYIGLEMASVWHRLGARVTVIEFLDRITPSMDAETAGALHKSLLSKGIEFCLSTKVTGITFEGELSVLETEFTPGGDKDSIKCNVVLVAAGRRPFTEGLGLQNLGVLTDERGFIRVDNKFETNIPGIYAIGDVIPGPMLAHKAEEEGVVAVEMMAGQAGHVNYKCIPAVIYTSPEVASVGASEESLKEEGTPYRVGKFPFNANSRARSSGMESSGFVKILAHGNTDAILGAHIIGPDAGTMISELTLAMEFSASAEDVARTCHAHPTLNEAVKEACLAAYNKPIHL